MGYTNYWERTNKPITQEFVDGVLRIIKESEKKGISIRGWDGNGEPEVTLDKVVFNGNESLGLDHESCFFSNNEAGFEFCKTAEKPYDYTVKRVLRLAKRQGLISRWSCDGECKFSTDADWR